MTTAAILLNYNDAEATIDAMKRIEHFKAIDCIVVMDNASADDSLKKLEPAARECVKKTVLIKNKKNGGYGYGNNIGVRYAYDVLKTELAVIANPDAAFSESLIKKMQAVFKEHQDTGVVGAVMSDAKQLEKTALKNYDELKRSGWCKRGFFAELSASGPILKRLFSDRINFSRDYYEKNAPLIPVYAVHGSLLMVDTKAFTECGGYDEDMFLYMEEYALGARMERLGKKTFLLSECYCHEGSHSISGAGNSAVKRQSFRRDSERIYFKKYLDAGAFKMLLLKAVQSIVMLETRLFVR
ncbi:MAG: glycosyltransferase [Lachnospiraceae bacterium]|nr:glycosyltransferase [Lachnospiraceae bacterium]